MEPTPGYAWDVEAAAHRRAFTFERDELASWAEPVAASAVDGVVCCWPLGLAFLAGSPGVAAFCSFLTLVLVLLVGVWEGRTGRGPGKAALGLRLVDIDSGRPVGAGRGVLRRGTHLIDSVTCYVGYLWPLRDEQRQTFADMAARTVVLSE